MKRSSTRLVCLATVLLSAFFVAAYRVAVFTPAVGVTAQPAAAR